MGALKNLNGQSGLIVLVICLLSGVDLGNEPHRHRHQTTNYTIDPTRYSLLTIFPFSFPLNKSSEHNLDAKSADSDSNLVIRVSTDRPFRNFRALKIDEFQSSKIVKKCQSGSKLS